jgi:hypothetical protein
VLELDGETVMWVPYAQRRALLEDLALGGGPWFVAEAFADGAALFAAACSLGLEGVVDDAPRSESSGRLRATQPRNSTAMNPSPVSEAERRRLSMGARSSPRARGSRPFATLSSARSELRAP